MDKKVTKEVSGPIEMWDSPIGGAYLIWRFVRGFASVVVEGPMLHFIFPALAIVMDASFSAEISRSGNLADFAFAFHDSSGKAAKSLAGLQERICEMRGWVLRSLEFAMVTRLVALDPETGRLAIVLREEEKVSVPFAKAFKDQEGRNAEQLGGMFAKTKEGDVAYYLGVKF